MGCCCEEDNKSNKKASCCVCHPYNDPFLLTAQVLSIVSILISWVWWVTLLLAMPAMIVLQVVWCCKMKRTGIVLSAIFSILTSIACLGAGIWILIQWKDNEWCSVFTFINDDDDYYNSRYDYCAEVAWSIVSFVDFGLWLSTGILILYFIGSGRYDACIIDNDVSNSQDAEVANTSSSIEMGIVYPMHAVTPKT